VIKNFFKQFTYIKAKNKKVSLFSEQIFTFIFQYYFSQLIAVPVPCWSGFTWQSCN